MIGSDADKKRARLDRISSSGTAKHPPEERAKPRRSGALAGVFWKGRCKIRGFELDPSSLCFIAKAVVFVCEK
jgi:hypothetical protein